MKLFQCSDLSIAAISDPTALSTPLGIVRFEVLIGDHTVLYDLPTATYKVSGGGWIAVWHNNDLEIELLICRPLFSPPLEMPVMDCWGALWRGRAKSASVPLVFSARWTEEAVWTEVSTNSGQYLYAKTWGEGTTDVTIGTQDNEMLALRARNNDHLPPQWEHFFIGNRKDNKDGNSAYWQHPIHQSIGSAGVPCPVPSLTEGQEFQILFAVAWDTTSELSSTATSIAVEVSPSQILAGVMCS